MRAYEADQKYKEGKFIIERSYLKPLGQNSEKYWQPDADSDDEQAIRFTRLLANNRTGRPTSAAGINLQQLFPGIRGRLISQALGIGGRNSSQDNSDGSDS